MDQEKGGYKGIPALQEVKKEISEIRKLIKTKKINLVNVEATVLSLNRWLSIIEKVDGPYHKIDGIRDEVNELIELRKSKGDPEHPTYLPEIHEWLVERAKKHPYEEGSSGFIID